MELVKPFYDDEKTQEHYAKRVKVIIEVVKGIYGESFNLEVFLPKVQELARCEIAIRYYSKQLANGPDKKETRSALRDDRMREAVLWEHLGLKMAGIEKSAKERDTKDSDNFEEHMNDMMEEADANGELDLDEKVRVLEHRPANVLPENEPVPAQKAEIKEIDVKNIKNGEIENAG